MSAAVTHEANTTPTNATTTTRTTTCDHSLARVSQPRTLGGDRTQDRGVQRVHGAELVSEGHALDCQAAAERQESELGCIVRVRVVPARIFVAKACGIKKSPKHGRIITTQCAVV